MTRYYVKSFRPEFDGLQTVTESHPKGQTTQTIEDIFDTFVINPNTLSFGWTPRLCSSILDDYHHKTYRPQGLIFVIEEDESPDYVFPFDLNAITKNNSPIVEYGAIRSELSLHYNVPLINSFMDFASGSYEEMVEKFKNKKGEIHPEHILTLVNDFRQNQGREPLDQEHLKLLEYTEAIFLRPIKIKPIAIYGNNERSQYLAELYQVPHYQTAYDFYLTNK